MNCPECKTEFGTATNLASAAEVAERKNRVDIAKAPSPEVGKRYIEMLGDAIPVYKCPNCGFLIVDVAEAFIAMGVISSK